MEEEKLSWKLKTKRYIRECIRVVKITKKPSNLEFKAIVKVSGLGILAIGFIGFLFTMTKELLI